MTSPVRANTLRMIIVIIFSASMRNAVETTVRKTPK
jgi:hypothetical protein